MAFQKDELWKIYTRKNPHWLTSNVTLTPDGLRKLFGQTFDQGHELGVANGKALAQKKGAVDRRDPASRLLGDVLGF